MSDIEFRWDGDAIARKVEQAIRGVGPRAAEGVLTVAMMNAPVLSGTLRRSGTVTEGGLPDPGEVFSDAEAGGHKAYRGKVGEEDLSWYVSFNTPYAHRQHEEEGWHHPVGGTAKYLEKAFTQLQAGINQMFAAAVKNVLGG